MWSDELRQRARRSAVVFVMYKWHLQKRPCFIYIYIFMGALLKWNLYMVNVVFFGLQRDRTPCNKWSRARSNGLCAELRRIIQRDYIDDALWFIFNCLRASLVPLSDYHETLRESVQYLIYASIIIWCVCVMISGRDLRARSNAA